MKADLTEEASNLRTRLGFQGAGWIWSLPIYVLVIGVFGVFLPWQKGRDFLDSVILGAYACLGVVFAAPAAAPEFDQTAYRPESSGARGDFRVLRRTAGGRDAGARNNHGLCVAWRQDRSGSGFAVARGMRGVGLDALLGSEHSHGLAFDQDFAERGQGCGPIGVPGVIGGLLPPFRLASRDRCYEARGYRRCWLPSCFSWR